MTTNILTQDDYKKIDELNALLKNDPTNLELLLKKAFIYYFGYDDDNTEKTFKEIIKLYPDYLDAYFWLAYYFYLVPAKMNEAISIAKQGLKIDPNRGDFYAVIAWSIGESEYEFYTQIKKAIELEPSWLSTRISLIYFLIKRNKLNEAKKEIDEALKIFKQEKITDYKDKIKSYYEEFVTRRNDLEVKKDLNNFLKDIQKKIKKIE